MIRHLLKLVWHRKRANALIMTEIFLSFLILFAVGTIAISLASRWRAPLGFQWQNVWTMEVQVAAVENRAEGLKMTPDTSKEEKTHAQLTAQAVDRLLREIRTFPQVEAAGADAMSAYMQRTWTTRLGYKGHEVEVYADSATDDFAHVMNLQVLQGRWFTDDDEAQNYQAIVLDSDAAHALFGNREAIGQKLPAREFNEDQSLPADFRVVGVIAPYRKFGEFTQRNLRMVFFRVPNVARKSAPSHGNFTMGPEANQIVIRVRPGTPASFEAELSDRLRPASGGISYRIRRMDAARKTMLQSSVAPVAALSIVALFLILMVALGLSGVLWQTVTRRTREIGLRRAVGASGAGVRAQVIGEVAVLVTLAVILAAIVIAQLPLLGAFRLTTPGEVVLGFSAALAGIYAITLLCSAYPSWLASTVDPAEALRYE